MQLDLLSLFVVMALVGGLIYIIMAIRGRLADQKRLEEIAEQQFEASVLNSLNQSVIPVRPGQMTEVPSAILASHETPLGEDEETPSSTPTVSPASFSPPRSEPDNPFQRGIDQLAAPLLARLQAANLVREGITEYVPLHGNPSGSGIIQFRSGRRFLLLPWWESEAFICRNLKRFDGILMVTRDGGGVVATTVEDLIASSF